MTPAQNQLANTSSLIGASLCRQELYAAGRAAWTKGNPLVRTLESKTVRRDAADAAPGYEKASDSNESENDGATNAALADVGEHPGRAKRPDCLLRKEVGCLQ
jgi:hypothetical protein